MGIAAIAQSVTSDISPEDAWARFEEVPAITLKRVVPLTDANASTRSIPDTSPAKWYLAHTSWFFAPLILPSPAL